MPISRDVIYAALFARLQTSVSLCKTFSRKWLEPQQVGADQQPALLVLEGSETPDVSPERQPEWTLEAAVVVYVRTDEVAAPGKLLSDILDQIEGALEMRAGDGVLPTNRWNTTLGIPLKVRRVWISGAIEKEDGSATNGQGFISLPISIIAVP